MQVCNANFGPVGQHLELYLYHCSQLHYHLLTSWCRCFSDNLNCVLCWCQPYEELMNYALFPMIPVEWTAKNQCGHLPFLYLGLPVGGNPHHLRFWKPVVEKFQSKLATWKGKLLSFGGCITLLTSVLSALPLFYFSIFRVPKGVVRIVIELLGVLMMVLSVSLVMAQTLDFGRMLGWAALR
ncbi:hypothetical protein SLEP1_g23029 [Rubroshorea leprosula]|uniref:Uncharacterized protein n=1 Tax=Rubroshorea leprosula TaxID=152421 RepID=A0AAV5JB67_9ROSI|nr:hypothetical protein SLEP1_g23029 [Rubroshorea leprosula]